ncbi:MAG: arrestin family protein [Promethearchaeota archaeon]
MREIEIIPSKSKFRAGDVVEGYVIVRCDDDFKHNGIRLTFKGREHTRIVISTGKSTHVHTDEFVYFDNTVYIEEAGHMSVGEKRLPFQFQFPDDLETMLSSYSGRNGWIEYSLEVVIERSLAIDPKEKVVLDFQQPETQHTAQQPQRGFVEDDGKTILDVEVGNSVFCIGDAIPVRFRVANDVKIREVRVKLNSKETVHADGYKRSSTKMLLKKSLSDEYVQRGLWMDVQLEIDESTQPTFDRPIIRNVATVKVTLNRPWARDTVVEIPISLDYCREQIEPEFQDSFEF